MIVEVAGVLTHLGDYELVLAVGAVLWWRLDLDGPLVAAAVSIVVVTVLKSLIGAPRPPGASIGGYAFPSGHASVSTAVALTLALSIDVLRPRVRYCAALSFGLVIASTRVLIGVHYLRDVAAGLLLGVVIALIVSRSAVSARSQDAAESPRWRAETCQK